MRGDLPHGREQRFHCLHFDTDVRGGECVRRQGEAREKSDTPYCTSGKCTQGARVARLFGEEITFQSTPVRRRGTLPSPNIPTRLPWRDAPAPKRDVGNIPSATATELQGKTQEGFVGPIPPGEIDVPVIDRKTGKAIPWNDRYMTRPVPPPEPPDPTCSCVIKPKHGGHVQGCALWVRPPEPERPMPKPKNCLRCKQSLYIGSKSDYHRHCLRAHRMDLAKGMALKEELEQQEDLPPGVELPPPRVTIRKDAPALTGAHGMALPDRHPTEEIPPPQVTLKRDSLVKLKTSVVSDEVLLDCFAELVRRVQVQVAPPFDVTMFSVEQLLDCELELLKRSSDLEVIRKCSEIRLKRMQVNPMPEEKKDG